MDIGPLNVGFTVIIFFSLISSYMNLSKIRNDHDCIALMMMMMMTDEFHDHDD